MNLSQKYYHVDLRGGRYDGLAMRFPMLVDVPSVGRVDTCEPQPELLIFDGEINVGEWHDRRSFHRYMLREIVQPFTDSDGVQRIASAGLEYVYVGHVDEDPDWPGGIEGCR